MSLLLNGTDGVTFNDGSEQWAAASPIGTKNLIINGDMRIAQRGTSVTGITTNGYRTCDRWNVGVVTAGTWTITQDSDVPSGQGFANSIKYDCTTADASLSANDYVFLGQFLEGQMVQHLKKGTSSAESVTLSFWVKSNKTGTYTIEVDDNDNNRSISKTYTIDTADTWEKKILTFTGDTTGTFANDNGASLRVYWWLAAGSTWSSGTLQTTWDSTTNANRVSGSNVNIADSTSNYINITGVQLEVGDTATPFEHRPYDMELVRCERYYQKIIDRTNAGGSRMWLYAISGGNIWRRLGVTYRTVMREQPTATITASAGGGGTFVSGYPVFSNTDNFSGSIIGDLTSAGDNYYAFVDDLYLDAEL